MKSSRNSTIICTRSDSVSSVSLDFRITNTTFTKEPQVCISRFKARINFNLTMSYPSFRKAITLWSGSTALKCLPGNHGNFVEGIQLKGETKSCEACGWDECQRGLLRLLEKGDAERNSDFRREAESCIYERDYGTLRGIVNEKIMTDPPPESLSGCEKKKNLEKLSEVLALLPLEFVKNATLQQIAEKAKEFASMGEDGKFKALVEALIAHVKQKKPERPPQDLDEEGRDAKRTKLLNLLSKRRRCRRISTKWLMNSFSEGTTVD